MDVDLVMAVDVLPTSALEISAQALRRKRVRGFLVAGLVLLLFGIWLGLEAPRGIVFGTDELLTAERSREMLMTGPWVVHYNFEPSFSKPPLQYWLTSFTLSRFQDPAVAVRIWPLFYGVLTAIALGWLAFLIEPNEPWLIPIAVVILISAPLFSTESARGLLDIGLTLFTTLTFVFAQLARKKPAWWLGVAAACWLGGLQKIPLPFLIWLLIVLVRLADRDERSNLRKAAGWLVGSMLLAIGLMSIWPSLQLIKYGMPVRSLLQQEAVHWLDPSELGGRPYFEVPIALCSRGGLCGFLSLFAVFAILFSKKISPSAPVREIAIVSLSLIALIIVSNFRSVRYAVPIVPCLCLLLAVVFYRFLKVAPPLRNYAIAVFALVLAAGFAHSETQIVLRHKKAGDEKLIAEKLGQLQQPGIKTILIKAAKTESDLLWDSFYLFHGNFRFPVTKLTPDQIRASPPTPPLIGACVARDFPVVQNLYPNVQVALSRAQFICWQVPAE